MAKQKIWYIQTESHTKRVFTDEDYARFLAAFDVTVNDTGKNLTSDEVAEGIGGFDGLVTGWGAPALTPEVMENADSLQIVAHSAGSIKGLAPKDIVETYLRPREIVLFSANGAIAYNVAESTVGMLLMASHRWGELSQSFRETGVWRPRRIRWNGQFLMGSKVGVLGASKVGREVIRLLSNWPLELLLYDPYVSDAEAEQLGCRKAELEEIFSTCDHVTMHLPNVPETNGMVTRELIESMKPGATLVNTSRANSLDHNALLDAAAAGKVYAMLDVTDPEPLQPNSEFRTLRSVEIAPHVSGAGFYGYHMIGKTTIDALEDCFAGNPVQGAVNYDRYDILA